MKRVTAFLGALILVTALMVGCGQTPSTPNASGSAASTPPAVSGNTSGDDSQSTLDRLTGLLGLQDSEVTAIMGEGVANFPEGDPQLINREYDTDLFGEAVVAAVNYDDTDRVSDVNITLSDRELDFYKTELEKTLGAHQSADQDTNQAEGNGLQSYSWVTQQAQITLKRAYDINSLEIFPAA